MKCTFGARSFMNVDIYMCRNAASLDPDDDDIGLWSTLDSHQGINVTAVTATVQHRPQLQAVGAFEDDE